MEYLRTRFAKDIVAEFVPPVRRTKKDRVIILADGAPSVPKKRSILEFFAKKGFWVIHPRYRGSWESDGKFLQKSLDLDLIDIIDQLPKGFTSLWDKKVYKVKPHKIILAGGSFGGPAVLLASRDPRVSKTIAICPVIDWKKLGKKEPLDFMETFFAEAFGNGYRFASGGWKKLTSGKFYNPTNHISEIDGKNILMMHAKDDPVCPYKETKNFANTTGSKLITLPRGGHIGISLLIKPRFYNIFKKFINS